MKTVLTVLGVGLGMVLVGLAELERPVEQVVPAEVPNKDLGLYVSPVEDVFKAELLRKPGQDAMLRKLMAEMLWEAEQDKKEMEKPVELPKLDAPELQRLLRGGKPPGWMPNIKRWTLGVYLEADTKDRIVVNGVMSDSPAQKAGLKAGDDLQDVNGILLRDHAMLVELLQVIRDQEVELGVRRGEEEVRVKMKAAQMDLPDVNHWQKPPVAPVVPKPRMVPEKNDRDDEVMKELRGMRGLMEEMLKELKKPVRSSSPRVRRLPTPPSN